MRKTGRWLLRYFRLGRTVKGLLRPGGKESVSLMESLLEERQKKDGAEDASAPSVPGAALGPHSHSPSPPLVSPASCSWKAWAWPIQLSVPQTWLWDPKEVGQSQKGKEPGLLLGVQSACSLPFKQRLSLGQLNLAIRLFS